MNEAEKNLPDSGGVHNFPLYFTLHMDTTYTKNPVLECSGSSAGKKVWTADNPTAAAEVAQRIWDVSQMLADQPGMGRPGRVAGTRELVIAGLPYILPYVEKAGVVTILRVMHTSMKWPKKF